MAGEISSKRTDIDAKAFNLADAVGDLLPRGHVIHGYSDASSNRMLMVLESRMYSDSAPLLGFGIDGQAERALGRALMTYAMREQDGLKHIKEDHYPESTAAQVFVGSNKSRFDNIVWGSDFKLYQEGDIVVASSTYGGGYGMSPLEVTAPDALAAIVLLADTYEFMNNAVKSLPAISLE
jgi:hypothetical protein